jgi:fructan beta-fructosidase
MHWGYATSTDLVHWHHEPIALYPDSVGYIFSGSTIVDTNNTSGLGTAGNPPLVALYTSHNKRIENEGGLDFQAQSIAYSNDNGTTWNKYSANPVLKNPGIKDFRDPKICWFEAGKKWIMTLATQDCVSFYSSKDLKAWTKVSEFGKTIGAHGGVWECPDLISLKLNGKTYWVLIVSLNPGGPNSGSSTQYFIGDFDGQKFIPVDTKTRWLDYGPDDYAGVTWSNTGDRKIFIGWMSNWSYASSVPTVKWRSASTVPRELQLHLEGNEILVSSNPATEFSKLDLNKQHFENLPGGEYDLSSKTGALNGPAKIEIKTTSASAFHLNLSNHQGQQIVVGYDEKSNQYFIDRTKSGKTSFNKEFAARLTAPKLSKDTGQSVTLIIDNASIELFADNGLTVMTAVFFPDTDYSKMKVQSASDNLISSLDFTRLKSIY